MKLAPGLSVVLLTSRMTERGGGIGRTFVSTTWRENGVSYTDKTEQGRTERLVLPMKGETRVLLPAHVKHPQQLEIEEE